MSLAAPRRSTIQVLERAGLVTRTVDGRRHVCRLGARPAHLRHRTATATAWLRFYERHWEQRRDALMDLFRDDTPKKGD